MNDHRAKEYFSSHFLKQVTKLARRLLLFFSIQFFRSTPDSETRATGGAVKLFSGRMKENVNRWLENVSGCNTSNSYAFAFGSWKYYFGWLAKRYVQQKSV